MSLSSAVTKTQSFFSNDTLQRIIKTVVEVIAAQAALYGTVVPNPPTIQTSGAVAGGAGVLALVWNLVLAWAGKRKAAQLVKLQAAVDAAAQALFTKHSIESAAAQAPGPGNAA